jgi:hypothetical protein
MVYLVKVEYKNNASFKVGYTSDMEKRLQPYRTHNPGFEHISMVETYAKTGMELEKAILQELIGMGVEFIGSHKEWFFVDYDSELYNKLNELGLLFFKACKGRKELMR